MEGKDLHWEKVKVVSLKNEFVLRKHKNNNNISLSFFSPPFPPTRMFFYWLWKYFGVVNSLLSYLKTILLLIDSPILFPWGFVLSKPKDPVITEKVAWKIFFNEYSWITQIHSSNTKVHIWVLKETEGVQSFLVLCWKKGNNESEAIPSLKQLAVMESIGCRKHWSSQEMLIKLFLTHPRVFPLSLSLL